MSGEGGVDLSASSIGHIGLPIDHTGSMSGALRAPVPPETRQGH